MKSISASLDIDAQKCFTPLCPNELPIPGGDLIAAELNAQAKLARLRIGSKDAHSESATWIATKDQPECSPLSGEHVHIAWKKHAIVGERGFELLDTLPHPAEYDFFVWKGIEPDMHPYGACYHDLNNKQSTGLIEYLRAQKIEIVIVGGLALDYCVKTTVLQLLNAKFQVMLNKAACRGLEPDTTQAALDEMQYQGAIFLENAAALAAQGQ